MNKTLLACLVSGVMVSGVVMVESFKFAPISESAYDAEFDINAPFLIPEGFKQIRVKDESLLNIYADGMPSDG